MPLRLGQRSRSFAGFRFRVIGVVSARARQVPLLDEQQQSRRVFVRLLLRRCEGDVREAELALSRFFESIA
jgi:hypothetical protein